MTPNIAVIHIANPYWRGFNLWLPLFLLWIPVILLSPIILLVLLAYCFLARVSFWKLISVSWGILCALPGTDIRVRAEDNNILIRIL
jgi:hypothetical protein